MYIILFYALIVINTVENDDSSDLQTQLMSYLTSNH